MDQARNKTDWECQGIFSGNFIHVNTVICIFNRQADILYLFIVT